MSSENDFDLMVKPKRSTFLTVLCILSFVGSGWAILSSAGSLLMMSNGTLQKLQAKAKADQANASERMKASNNKNAFALKIMESSKVMMDPEKQKSSAIYQFIAALATLGGALLMFYQKIIGYAIYIVGCLIGVGFMLYLFGTNNFITNITVSFTGIVSLIFIILYGMCVKEMNKQQPIV